MKRTKFRAYLKNIDGLNKHHFDTHGRIYDVLMIDWENEEVRVRVPSELTFSFKDVEIMQWIGFNDINGKEIYNGDILDGIYDTKYPPYLIEIPKCFYDFEEFFSPEDGKVIGNILETPELLNE